MAQIGFLELDGHRSFCIEEAFAVGHPFQLFLVCSRSSFSTFSGLPNEVRWACECTACMSPFNVINNRRSKLGEWLRWFKKIKINNFSGGGGGPEGVRARLQKENP